MEQVFYYGMKVYYANAVHSLKEKDTDEEITVYDNYQKAMSMAKESCLWDCDIPVVYRVMADRKSVIKIKKDGCYFIKQPYEENIVWADISKIKISLPKDVLKIFEKLECHGYEAFVVGGCVRDSVLGKIPHDWDICTNAKPEEIISCMEDDYSVIPTGLKHGTVTVIPKKGMDGKANVYEITTYRADGEYTDGRHPDKVEFVSDIHEDLGRRDFTINAMAYHPKSGITDPYGGLVHLIDGILCCVGNPYDRFSEDALRIMRALRFASNYGLFIEHMTCRVMCELSGNLNGISKERVTSELLKMLGSFEKPGKVFYQCKEALLAIIPCMDACDGFYQKPWHEYDVMGHCLKAVDSVNIDSFKESCHIVGIDDEEDIKNSLAMVRVAALLHDIGKPFSQEYGSDGTSHFKEHEVVSKKMAQAVFETSFRMTSKMEKDALTLISEHENRREAKLNLAKRLIHKLGKKNAIFLVELQKADILAHGELDSIHMGLLLMEYDNLEKMSKLLKQVVESNAETSVKDLKINGNDLKELGIPESPEYRKILNQCLEAVMDGKVENKKEDLKDFVKKNSNNNLLSL